MGDEFTSFEGQVDLKQSELLAISSEQHGQEGEAGSIDSLPGFHWIKDKDGSIRYYVSKFALKSFEMSGVELDSNEDLDSDDNLNSKEFKSQLYNEAETRLIGKYMVDKNNPLKARMRALFVLRNLETPVALEVMNDGFKDDSVILKHEVAYCMGQTQLIEAIPYLKKVLADPNEHQIVRHEAVEALGAIGTKECANSIVDYINDESQVVRDSVKLALARIATVSQGERSNRRFKKTKFNSVDPAFPIKFDDNSSLSALETILLDPNLDIYTRYRAMFALRDIGSTEAISIICKGLHDKNPLFKHEVAFVLGQLQCPTSEHALEECLMDERQDEMVRHECAEALGAIGTPSAAEVLKPLTTCSNRIVRESVEIALDINEYEMSGNLEYCNGSDLIKVA